MSFATAPFEVPNLDHLTTDPAELREVGILFQRLARFAEKKASAMEHRRHGNIGVAILLERDLETLYRCLPEWAKW